MSVSSFKNLVNTASSPMMLSQFVRFVDRSAGLSKLRRYFKAEQLVLTCVAAFIVQAYASDPEGFWAARTVSAKLSAALFSLLSSSLLLDSALNFALRLHPDSPDLEAQRPVDEDTPFVDGLRFGAMLRPDVDVFHMFFVFLSALVSDAYTLYFNVINKVVTHDKKYVSYKKPYLETYLKEFLVYQHLRFQQMLYKSRCEHSVSSVYYNTPFPYNTVGTFDHCPLSLV